MRQQIQSAFKLAFKNKDKIRLNTIKSINAKVQLLDKNGKLSDDQIANVVSKLIKERDESIKQYKKANRNDLVQQESVEKSILLDFMPKQLSRQDIAILLQPFKDKPIQVVMKEFPYPSSIAPRSIIKELMDSFKLNK